MNLKGGYKILNLGTLSSAGTITDSEILNQLSDLRMYINGDKQLKPVLIHCKINESGITKHSVMGELVKESAMKYCIIAKIKESTLKIDVEFTEDEETQQIYIASGDASYTLVKDIDYIEVEDIKTLTNAQIESLQCGDIVIKSESNGEKHAYLVAYRKSNEMSLVYCDAHNVEEVYYEKSGNNWAWVVTEITPIDKAQTEQDIINLLGSGNIPSIKGNEIIENMIGYSFSPSSTPVANLTREYIYVGIVKNGNKLTYVYALNLTRTGSVESNYVDLGTFTIPQLVANKIYPTTIGGADFVDLKDVLLNAGLGSTNKCQCYTQKGVNALSSATYINDINSTLVLNQKYYVRYEVTILLSENLVE